MTLQVHFGRDKSRAKQVIDDRPTKGDQPTPRWTPHRVGHYTPAAPLAVGGMAEVWLARNTETGAQVALKVPTQRRFRQRLIQEGRVTAQLLGHPHVIEVRDIEGGADPVLVLEYLRGETLRSYVEREGPLPTEQALAVLLPILSALKYAHAHGIVHRDVTPANIFLSVNPGEVVPKLFDFGIAKPEAPLVRTSKGVVWGTAAWMSPEQALGDAPVDHRSDLFSFAAVVYYAISGVSPFGAHLAGPILREAKADDRIHPVVWRELKRALSKTPAERHESAGVLASALRTAVEVPCIRIRPQVAQPHATAAPTGPATVWPLAMAGALLLLALLWGLHAGESSPNKPVPAGATSAHESVYGAVTARRVSAPPAASTGPRRCELATTPGF